MYVCMYVCEYLGSSGGSHVEHQLNALHRGSVRQLNEEHRTLCIYDCMYVCMYVSMYVSFHTYLLSRAHGSDPALQHDLLANHLCALCKQFLDSNSAPAPFPSRQSRAGGGDGAGQCGQMLQGAHPAGHVRQRLLQLYVLGLLELECTYVCMCMYA